MSGVRWRWFAVFWLLFILMIGLRVERMHRALGCMGILIPRLVCYRSIVETSFWGTVTPARVGEIYKITYLVRFGMPAGRGVVYLLSERLYDLLALMVFATAGAILLAGHFSQFVVLRNVLIAALVLTLALGGIAWLRGAQTKSLIMALMRMVPMLGRTLTERFLGDVLLVNRKSGWILWLYSVAWVLCNIAQAYSLAQALRIPVGMFAIALGYSVSTVLAALPVSVAGLGTREAGYILILGLAGIDKEQALVLSLLDGVVLPLIGVGTLMLPLIVTKHNRKYS